MSRTEADIRKELKQRKSAAPKVKKAKPSKRGVGGAGVPPQLPPDAVGSQAVPGGVPTGGKGQQTVLVGRAPRVDLLPTEVHVERKERATARRAWLGVVVLVVVVGLGTGAATVHSLRSGTDLTNTQDETNSLLLQQQKYSEVRDVERQSTLIKAGQEVGGSTEIDWQKYLTDLQSSLPAGVTITGIAADSASPMETYAQSSTPLQGERIGTLTISTSSATIPSVPDWTQGLSTLDGYVDSNISSISRAGDGGQYTASITLHIDEKAYDAKYAGDK